LKSFNGVLTALAWISKLPKAAPGDLRDEMWVRRVFKQSVHRWLLIQPRQLSGKRSASLFVLFSPFLYLHCFQWLQEQSFDFLRILWSRMTEYVWPGVAFEAVYASLDLARNDHSTRISSLCTAAAVRDNSVEQCATVVGAEKAAALVPNPFSSARIHR
jgi:hypothetical protein